MTVTQDSRPWAGKTVGDAGPYTFEEWHQAWRALSEVEARPFAGWLSGFIPTLSTPSNNSIRVTAPLQRDNTARRALAMLDGLYYRMDNSSLGDDGSEDLTIVSPSGSTRVDLVVIRADWAAQTVRLAVRAGVEGAGIEPDPVQLSGSTFELPIGSFSITTGGVITIVFSEIRSFFQVGVQPDVQAIFFDDFMGAIVSGAILHSAHHWNVAVTGTAAVSIPTILTAGMYGDVQLSSGATINSTAHLNAPGLVPGQSEVDLRVRVRQVDITEFEWLVGLSTDTASITPADGIFFRGNHGVGAVNLEGVTRKDGTETTVDLGITGDVDKAIYLRAVREQDEVFFFVNSEFVGSSTTNIPVDSDDLSPNIYAENTEGVDKDFHVDFVWANFAAAQGFSPRWAGEI